MLKSVNLLLIFLLPHLLPPTLSKNASGQEVQEVQEVQENKTNGVDDVNKDGTSPVDTEEADEFSIEIVETEKQRERVRARLGFLDKRLDLLRKRQNLKKKIGRANV